MTLRSDPRPGCTHCNGSGIVSVSKDPDEIAGCGCTDPAEVKIERAKAALRRFEDRNSKPNPAHLAEAVRDMVALAELSSGRVRATIAEMDEAMYGDPEVPFRMRALLEGKSYV